MINILLTVLSLVVCFGMSYWAFGWVLAFIVVSSEAIYTMGAIVILACVTMAIVSRGQEGNRWWARMILGIIAVVAIEMLEPYVGVVRLVLAAVASIWATIILYQHVIRRIPRRTSGSHT